MNGFPVVNCLPQRHSQRGVALVIALVFLLLLTIIGVTAMQTSTLQERMAGNARDRNIAFQFAEEALRDAENRLQQEDLSDSAVTLPEVHEPEDAPDWRGLETCEGGVRPISLAGFDEAELAAADPCYFIEVLEIGADGRLPGGDTTGRPIDDVAQTLFRVTAIGFGTTTNTRVVLRSVTAGFGAGGDTGDNGDNGDNGGGGNGGPPPGAGPP